MGWTEMQFYLCTPAFFYAAYEGYAEHQQLEWGRARYIAFHAIQPLKPDVKNWKINTLQDLGLFPWEKEQVKKNVPQLTPEQYKTISDKLDAMLEQQYGIQVITPEA